MFAFGQCYWNIPKLKEHLFPEAEIKIGSLRSKIDGHWQVLYGNQAGGTTINYPAVFDAHVWLELDGKIIDIQWEPKKWKEDYDEDINVKKITYETPEAKVFPFLKYTIVQGTHKAWRRANLMYKADESVDPAILWQ